MSGASWVAAAGGVPCGLLAAALHLTWLRRSLGGDSGDPSALLAPRASLLSAPLRALCCALLLAGPALLGAPLGTITALPAFALASSWLRWRALREVPA